MPLTVKPSAAVILREADIFPSTPTNNFGLFQVCCADVRCTVNWQPAAKIEALPWTQWAEVRKGPMSEVEAKTFCLCQALLAKIGEPALQCEPVQMRCDPERKKQTGRGPRLTTHNNVDWFVVMECAHRRFGYPADQPLPFTPYVPKSKKKNGDLRGSDWTKINTQVVDHAKLTPYLMSGDYEKCSFEVLKSTLARYVFGLLDMAGRNLLANAAQTVIYQADADKFSTKTQNPLGRYLKSEPRRKGVHTAYLKHKQNIDAALRQWAVVLGSENVAALCQADMYRCIWKLSAFASLRDFQREIQCRIAFILHNGVMRLDTTRAPRYFIASLRMADVPTKTMRATLPELIYEDFSRTYVWPPAAVTLAIEKLSLRVQKRKRDELEDGEIVVVDTEEVPAAKRVKRSEPPAKPRKQRPPPVRRALAFNEDHLPDDDESTPILVD